MMFGMLTSPGSLIAHRYALLDLVGEGGMGQVFRAHDRLMGQTVALKRVRIAPPADKSDEESMTRSVTIPSEMMGTEAMSASLSTFRDSSSSVVSVAPSGTVGRPIEESSLRLLLAQEFRALAGLRHPHIISVLDYGFDGELPYFTMEYLSDACDLLTAGAHRDHAGKLTLLAQTLSALHYLHRHGILHRDLKPRNVLFGMTRQESRGESVSQIKLLDFGLAAARGASPRAGELMGTARGNTTDSSDSLTSEGVHPRMRQTPMATNSASSLVPLVIPCGELWKIYILAIYVSLCPSQNMLAP